MEFDGWTLLLQAINFAVLIWILQRFLYQPLTGLIEKRQQATRSAFAKAEERERVADEARAGFESRQKELEAERQTMLDDARATIAQERDEMRETTRRKAQAELQSARSKIGQEKERAAAVMVQDAVSLAGELSKKLLAGVATPVVAGSLLESVLDRLEALPAERRQALRDEVGAGGKLIVASSPALGADQQARCRERLGPVVADTTAVEFATDDALIVGAELRFPNATIGYSWRDALSDALVELRGDERPV